MLTVRPKGTRVIEATTDVLAEALFVCALQPSQRPCAAAIRGAIIRTLLQHGDAGCAVAVAAEFGDHPETAVSRMTWARHMLSTMAAYDRRCGCGDAAGSERAQR